MCFVRSACPKDLGKMSFSHLPHCTHLVIPFNGAEAIENLALIGFWHYKREQVRHEMSTLWNPAGDPTCPSLREGRQKENRKGLWEGE